MLDALMLLSAVAAFGYIVVWALRNDNAASIGAQRGLLRMQPHETEGPDMTANGGEERPVAHAGGGGRGRRRSRRTTTR